MIGRLLDDHIAGPHVHHRVVEHHVDLARQHDGIIDGARAVHQRVPHGKAPPRRALADNLHHEIRVHFRLFGRIERRKFDQSSAVPRSGGSAVGLAPLSSVNESGAGAASVTHSLADGVAPGSSVTRPSNSAIALSLASSAVTTRRMSAAVAVEQARTSATIEPKILLVIACSFVLFRSFPRKRESRVAWVPAFAGTSGCCMDSTTRTSASPR